MAHTAAGKGATEAHRRDQARLSASVVDIIRDIFLDTFRTNDIDGSSREFVRAALPVVLESRTLSHDMAQTYLDTFRRAELRGLVDHSSLQGNLEDPLTVDPDIIQDWVDADMVTEDALDLLPEPDQVAVSLYSSSAAVAKREIGKGRSEDQARDTAKNAVAAKAQKLVADGGRAPLEKEVNQKRYGAVGYARVVDPDPCPFCAMLASRGAVYRTDSFNSSNSLFTGDGRFKVHDGCGCLLEPVYGRRLKDLPPNSAKYAKEWAEYASGQPDPFSAWSRWIESGTKPGEERGNAQSGTAGSAPQYGRAKDKANGQKKSRRKALTEMDREELSRTLRGMYVRRAGMEKQLAELEAAGQSVREPGPAAQIDRKLDRINQQIKTAQRRLGTLTS